MITFLQIGSQASLFYFFVASLFDIRSSFDMGFFFSLQSVMVILGNLCQSLTPYRKEEEEGLVADCRLQSDAREQRKTIMICDFAWRKITLELLSFKGP